jgi:Cu(I)/Ag(I) efflux system membrane fusion protein
MKKISVVIILIAITVLAFLAGGWYGKDRSDISKARVEREVLYYTDPMNPGFRSDEPGVAPCGMPLEPVYADPGDKAAIVIGGPPQSPGAVKISRARQQLIGVKVEQVKREPMTHSLRLYGKIVPDETRIYRVNASTDSWVRALSDMTTGSIVARDQILAEILAPAFYNAQVTYLVTLNNIDRIREQLSGELRHQQTEIADNQIRVAVQSLQNLGITDAQIEELANTRKAQPLMQVRSPTNGVILARNISLYQWFKAGDEFYSIADLHRVWVYADVYEDEAMHLWPGMEVEVQHVQMGKTFDAQISRVLPLFDPVAKTLKVRLDVDNPQYDLRPDMFVDIEIPITMPPALHVPADAVIDSGTQKIVYVDIGNSTFEPRRVETGWRLGRRVEITEGLMPGEKVIVSGNFLIDSESRMKTAAAGIQGVARKDPVCGMYVDEEKAKMEGRTATYDGKTYYFCMAKCRDSFEKEPEKYVPQMEAGGTDAQHGVKQMIDKSWMVMLESAGNSPVIKDGVPAAPVHRMKDTIGTPATFPGVVDWDGPNPAKEGEPPRDWSGWGKFPGAEYLGLKDNLKRKHKQRHDASEGDSESQPEDKKESTQALTVPVSKTDHSDMNHEMHELPAADGPAPDAD